ncbi:hypothetical protein A2999_01890 [Candidatus Wolfebacteria bacterium RIFCSPLOWO2_01_FULL_38_11]|uniref:Uncharacterized protein n=1 Tax=Candidatus Wolfebacteria bacterium RIFCSPLOWO2_01_FULL_38_11 TaxID=1802556 RepID=A0A1F8DPY4_9BACT|nr:MAG: hypothetical protein A2999_01890 [Candidatus Wolfebacteria bacterium RIFCSPLOWO2_01_FULL_38_11]
MQKGFLSIIALLIVLAIISFLIVSQFSQFNFLDANPQNSNEQPVNILIPQLEINDALQKIENQSADYNQRQEDIFKEVNNIPYH